MANRFLNNIRINDAYTFPASDGNDGQVITTDGAGNLAFENVSPDAASVIYRDNFTGDGSTVAFDLQNSITDEDQTQIYIDGVYQEKSTYSISGTTITFTTAPISGHSVEVISISSINTGPTVLYQDNFTGNGSTTAFTLGQEIDNEIKTFIFLNGVYQFKNTYTVDGTTLTFDTAPANGVAIEVVSIASAVQSDSLQAGAVIIPVKNTHTASITKGTPVYITGNVGASERLQIAPADASNSAKMPAAGLLLTTLAVNAEGYAITGGYLRNITTDTIDGTSTSSNDTVYVKAGGGLTMTKPTGTNLIQNIAKVARSASGSAGSLLVSSILRTNDVPNLTTGKIWVGDSNTVESTVIHLDESNNRLGINNNSPNYSLDVTGDANISSNVIIGGNLTVDGTQTILNTQTVEVEDNILQLNTTQGSPDTATATTSGISVYRGDGVTQASFIFDDADDTWDLTNNLVVDGNATINGFFTSQGIDDNANATAITINGSEEVGIGTLTPFYKLDVNGTFRASGNATFAGNITVSGYISLNTNDDSRISGDSDSIDFNLWDNSSAYQTRMTILDTGNIGIGTTSPSEKLEISGNMLVGDSHFIGNQTTFDNLLLQSSAGENIVLSSAQDIYLTTGGTSAGAVGDTRLFIKSADGNVGIGTTSPATKLHVMGTIKLGGYSYIGEDLSDLDSLTIASDHTESIHFAHFTPATGTYSTNMIIDTSGNVGIGTDSPQVRLTLRRESNGSLFELNRPASNVEALYGGISGNDPYFYSNNGIFTLGVNNPDGGTGGEVAYIKMRNGSTRYTTFEAGNVGIGTTSPTVAKLVISDTGSNKISIDGGTSQNGMRWEAVGGANAFYLFNGTFGSAGFGLYNINTAQAPLWIQNGGNVGIGTTSPGSKLEVNAQGGGVGGYTGIKMKYGTSSVQSLYMGQVTAGNGAFIGTAQYRNAGYWQSEGTASSVINMDSAGNMAFYTNSGLTANTDFNISERMRIDSSGNSTFSGNVNINGTTGTPSISVKNSSSGGNNQIFQRWQYVPNNTNFRLDLTQRETAGLVRYAFDLINNGTAYNSNLVLDRGNVGIGTDSPNEKLTVNGNIESLDTFVLKNSGGHKYQQIFQNTNDFVIRYNNSSSWFERMRITSGGDVLIGTQGTPNGTSVYGSAFTDETSNRMILRMASSTTGAVNLVQFYNGNGLVGKIQTDGSATSYITSSDYRLKENVVEMTGALDRVSQLRPSRFNFIADADKTVDGFLAHEVQDIVPEAITGEKDAVDEEGNPDYQGIDQSKLVPLLVGAIQELKADNDSLKARIETLENN